MSCECPSPRIEKHRFVQYLILVELVVTIVALVVSIATTIGAL
ncbi:hypothetical protein ACLI4Y_08095 [Natrialbaceae archaeon A-CW3]